MALVFDKVNVQFSSFLEENDSSPSRFLSPIFSPSPWRSPLRVFAFLLYHADAYHGLRWRVSKRLMAVLTVPDQGSSFSDHHNGLRTSKDNTNMADVTVWYNIWCSSRCCWSADQVWIPLDQTHVDSFQFGAGVPTCSLNVLTLPTYSTTSKLSSNGLPSKAVSIKKDYDAVAVSVKFTQCSDALLVL